MADTVDIACKLPNGVELEHEGKTVYVPGGRVALDENGQPIIERITPGGYGIRKGVDAAWWESFKKAHKGWPPLENEHIFALPSSDDIALIAKSNESNTTGLEGVKAKKSDKAKPGELSEDDTAQKD